jgi:SAM-dependent methyltransferase
VHSGPKTRAGSWPDFRFDDLRMRRAAYALYKWKPALFARTLSIDHLLVGGVERKAAATHARLLNSPKLPSTPISDSAYAQLLNDHCERGDTIFHPDLFAATAYWKHALACIRQYGHYCSHTDLAGVTEKARRFIGMFKGTQLDSANPHESRAGSLVEVRRIAHSRCFEILDGHHRLAIAWKNGQTHFRCAVLPTEPSLTPMQMMVMDSLWMFGKRRLLQPLPCPELREWPVVQHCDDLMRLIDGWLRKHGVGSGTFLDIGCGYGWFLAEMRKRGYRVRGIERDAAIGTIGVAAYGLRDHIQFGDASVVLGELDEPHDVVCCLGLMHDARYDQDSISMAILLRELDRLTKHVLFIDVEACRKARNQPWRLPFGEALNRLTSFEHIDVLGTDGDQGQNRQILACYRDHAPAVRSEGVPTDDSPSIDNGRNLQRADLHM